MLWIAVFATAVAAVVFLARVAAVRRASRERDDADTRSVLANLERVSALYGLGLLDGAARPELDELTRQAASRTGSPVALLSLVDADRQVFASSHGRTGLYASENETSLDYSYCKYVVGRDRPLAVTDAQRDPLVRENLATTERGVRAYLGVPLRTRSGHTVGAFCVVDDHPRVWSDADRAALESLATEAMARVEPAPA